ncbi:MAG TPA: Hsp20/alpha crystallin family protein [Gemmataceae bacterium]
MLPSWDPAFLDLQRRVDELFEELIYRPWAISGPVNWRPPLDLHETADGYLVEIDLPGVPPEEVHVLVSERELVVTARRSPRPPEGVLFQHCERRCGTFRRAVTFPRAVDPQQARAELVHGTCRVLLPKKPPQEGQAGRPALGVGGSHSVVVAVTVP